ncbi:PAS domain-containing protein [Streptomyces sp. M19]
MWRCFRQSPCAMAVFDLRLRLRRANADMERAARQRERAARTPDVADPPGPAGEETDEAMRTALATGTHQQLSTPSRPRPPLPPGRLVGLAGRAAR